MKALLPGIGEELEARMDRRVGHSHRLHGLDHEAGEPLVDLHLHLADRAAVEAGRCPESEGLRGGVEEVDRADLRAYAIRHHLHDTVEGLLQVLRLADQGADMLEETYAVSGSRACLSR